MKTLLILSGLGTGIIPDYTEKENESGSQDQGIMNSIMKYGINSSNQSTINGLNIVLIIIIIMLLSSNSQSN